MGFLGGLENGLRGAQPPYASLSPIPPDIMGPRDYRNKIALRNDLVCLCEISFVWMIILVLNLFVCVSTMHWSPTRHYRRGGESSQDKRLLAYQKSVKNVNIVAVSPFPPSRFTRSKKRWGCYDAPRSLLKSGIAWTNDRIGADLQRVHITSGRQ